MPLWVGRCLVLAHLFSSRKQWLLSGHQFSLLQVNGSLKFISKNIWEICGVIISTNIWSALSCLTAWCFPRMVRDLFNLGEPRPLTLTSLVWCQGCFFAMSGWTNVTWLRHPMKKKKIELELWAQATWREVKYCSSAYTTRIVMIYILFKSGLLLTSAFYSWVYKITKEQKHRQTLKYLVM